MPVVGQQIRNGADRAGKEQRRQKLRIAVPAVPEGEGTRRRLQRPREAGLDAHGEDVARVNAAHVHENRRVVRGGRSGPDRPIRGSGDRSHGPTHRHVSVGFAIAPTHPGLPVLVLPDDHVRADFPREVKVGTLRWQQIAAKHAKMTKPRGKGKPVPEGRRPAPYSWAAGRAGQRICPRDEKWRQIVRDRLRLISASTSSARSAT